MIIPIRIQFLCFSPTNFSWPVCLRWTNLQDSALQLYCDFRPKYQKNGLVDILDSALCNNSQKFHEYWIQNSHVHDWNQNDEQNMNGRAGHLLFCAWIYKECIILFINLHKISCWVLLLLMLLLSFFCFGYGGGGGGWSVNF